MYLILIPNKQHKDLFYPEYTDSLELAYRAVDGKEGCRVFKLEALPEVKHIHAEYKEIYEEQHD